MISSCVLLLAFPALIVSMTMSNKDMTKLIGRIPKPLPPPMTSNIVGTWAHSTMSKRIIDDIFNRLIDDNADELTQPTSSLRSECFLVLNDLKSSVLCGTTGYLRGIYDEGSDKSTWDDLLSTIPENQRNWLDAPWIISEFYFYRRINEAFKFFETGYDMFEKQKAAGLSSCIAQVNEIAKRLPLLLQINNSENSMKDDVQMKLDIENALKVLILTSLWGNKADLSLWPALKDSNKNDSGGSSSGSNTNPNLFADSNSCILDNHIDKVISILTASTTGTSASASATNSIHKKEVSIVVDNAGYELVTDLILGYGLIKLGVADVVTFHTKGHPTFVSDATTHDCIQTIQYLATEESSPAIMTMAKDMSEMIQKNQLRFVSDVFWCQPSDFWNMPDMIQNKLSQSTLVFVKGDANYRRLLGEREWPLITTASDILSYWHVPVCALRTFKSEMGCGVSVENQNKARTADDAWMVSGKWGVIQVGGPGI